MKLIKTVIAVSALALVAGCTKDPAAKLETNKQKVSYAIGQQIGQNIKMQKIQVDAGILAAAIDDVTSGKESRLSDEDMQKALQTMQEEMVAERKKEADDNLAKGKAFLEKNKTAEGFKTTASGLQYKIITEGKGKKPKDKDFVEVHYKGTLTDGTEFDSSYKRNETAKFPVEGVIPGWTEALKLMSEGSKWSLVIPSELAYGERGRPGIPANSVLLFEVELIKISDK